MSSTPADAKYSVPGPMQSSWLLGRLYLNRSIFRSRSILVLVLIAINALLAILAKEGENPFVYREHVGQAFFGFVLPAIALLIGVGVVRDEVDGGTLPYLLLRPISRRTLYLSRLATACLVTMVAATVCAVTNALVLGDSLPPVDITDDLTVAAPVISLSTGILVSVLGGAVFTAVFAAIGGVFKRPFIVGVAWLIGLEQMISSVAFDGRYAAVSAHLRNLAGLENLPDAGYLAALVKPIPGYSSVLSLVVLAGVATSLGLVVFQRREYVGDPPPA